jgi:hypothetical protein
MKSDAFRDGVERLDLDDTLAQMWPSVVLRGPVADGPLEGECLCRARRSQGCDAGP